MTITINKTEIIVDHILYVDAIIGSDTNSGSETMPFQTLSKAFDYIKVETGILATDKVGIMLGDGEYPHGSFTRQSKITSEIHIVGNTKSKLLVSDMYANTSTDPCKCTMCYYRLIWDGTPGGTTANAMGLKSINYFNNVVFQNIKSNNYSYFYVQGELYLNQCTKAENSTAFLRNNGKIQIQNSAGEFTSGYGTTDSMWNAGGNYIGSIILDSSYEVLYPPIDHVISSDVNPDGSIANPGVQFGRFGWRDWSKVTYYLEINKTLEANMPTSVEPGKEEIHFTEKGQIFITKQDGSFLACNTGTIIKEVSNPLTTKPLEYGSFEMSQQEISAEGVAVKLISRDSNILLVNDSISLKAGKTYRICANFTSVKSDTLGGWWYGFDDSMGNKIGIDARTLTVTHTVHVGRSGSTDFIYTPKEDISITLKSRSNGKCSIELGSVVIQEIRNNPVNQYGGFESQVLFEGKIEASKKDVPFSLSKDISDFDFLKVDMCVKHGSYIGDVYKSSQIISVDSIEFRYREFMHCLYSTSQICYQFTDKNTIMINSHEYANINWQELFITKITGIKGRLPSLLSGGEF